MQNTIKESVEISGIGIHSGKKVIIKLLPRDENSGIIFRSNDGSKEVQAKFDSVSSTNMSTKLSNGQLTVDLVEHLMAAIWGANIDNLVVELDSEEVPILDGSAKPFLDAINSIGTQSQISPRKILKVTEIIEVQEDDKYIRISPNENGLIIDMTIDFSHKLINYQKFIFCSNEQVFADLIAPARTFGFVKDLEYFHNSGLALGASLENCIGLTENGIANSENLRFLDEFVRHKILDCIGDLFLAGYYLNCRVTAYKSGHRMNNLALRELFKDEKNYEII